MGTRSTIAKKNEDGSFTSIYCHWDGYPSHNGRILKSHYTSASKVDELLSLGDLSSLGGEIGEKHDFDSHPDGVCTFYGRDRGEDGVEAIMCKSLGEVQSEEYTYVFDSDGQWKLVNEDGDELIEF